MVEKGISAKQKQLKAKMNEWLVKQETGDSDQWLDTHGLLNDFLEDTVTYGRVARALNLKDDAFYIKQPFSHGQYMVAYFTHPQSKPTVRITIVLHDDYEFDPSTALIELPKLAGTLDIEQSLRGRRAREDYAYLGNVPMDLTGFV